MSRLRLRTLIACDQTIVSIWGDIDLATSPLLRSRLRDLVASGCSHLVLNLSHTGYIDSTGLETLVRTHKDLRGLGGELAIVRCPPAINRVLHLVGFHYLFSIEERSTSSHLIVGPAVG